VFLSKHVAIVSKLAHTRHAVCSPSLLSPLRYLIKKKSFFFWQADRENGLKANVKTQRHGPGGSSRLTEAGGLGAFLMGGDVSTKLVD
jgi:hypothetical protein